MEHDFGSRTPQIEAGKEWQSVGRPTLQPNAAARARRFPRSTGRFCMKTVFRWTTAALFAVALAAGCATSNPVPTSTSSTALTFAASRVYAISAANYGQSWCPHGSVATDAASRCNSPTDTVLARLPVTWDADGDGAADPCHPVTASLTLQRQEWSDVATVDVRRILRPVVGRWRRSGGRRRGRRGDVHQLDEQLHELDEHGRRRSRRSLPVEAAS